MILNVVAAPARYEEPVVVKSDIVTSKLVLAITVGLLGPGPLQQVLVVVSGGRGLQRVITF